MNQLAVDRYRERQYRRASLLIGLIWVVGFVGGTLAMGFLSEAYGAPAAQLPLPVSMATCGSATVGVLLGRRRLRLRIDPNATYPRQPLLPPATPLALTERRDPESGAALLVPVTPRSVPVALPDERPAFRPVQVPLPVACCVCLGPPTRAYRPPLMTNDRSELNVPTCEACQRRLRRRWWLTLAIVVCASFGLSAGIAVVVPRADALGRWFLGGFVGLFLALVGGVVIAGRAARPYRLVAIDGDRGVARFSADNPGYTALVAEAIRLAEHAPRPMPV